MPNKKTLTIILLVLIVAFGFFLRIYNIDNTPPGIFADEAENAKDAMNVLKTGEYDWFYPGNQGREGLFMNLIALCFKLFGVSILALKLPSAIFGTLIILGTYLLTKELFNKERLALISAFLISVGFWAINFNRISFRANMLPFVLVFTFYFIFKGIRTRKFLDFAIGGLIFGIGMHTYIAFRIAPLILFILLGSFILSRHNFLKEYWKSILIFFIFSLISASPMFYTFWQHPEFLESRSSSISILSPEVNKGHLIQTFARSFGLSLAKYNLWGDQNWRHNYPPYPILDTLTGIGFLFGIIYSFLRFFKLFWERVRRKIRNTEMPSYALLTSWFFIMLVPEFMTAEGLPHALRAIGGLPVVFIFSAITFDYFIGKSKDRSYIFQKIVLFLTLLMFISIGAFNAVKYHIFWAQKTETAKAFDSYLKEISYLFISLPDSTEKYFISDEYESLPIKFFTSNVKNMFYVWPVHIQHMNPKNNFVIILANPKDEYLQEITKMLPNVNIYRHEKAGGGYFFELRNK